MNPNGFDQDYIVLADLRSPGTCVISGAGNPVAWDAVKGAGVHPDSSTARPWPRGKLNDSIPNAPPTVATAEDHMDRRIQQAKQDFKDAKNAADGP